MPHIALFKIAGSAAERQQGRQALAEEARKLLSQARTAPTRFAALTGMDEPRELQLYREGDDYAPPFDLALKIGGWDDKAVSACIGTIVESNRLASVTTYQTEEVVKKSPDAPLPAGAVPGIFMLHPLRFYADLPRSALLRSWRDIHGDLAAKAHSGASFYAQHLVLAELGGTGSSTGGFSEFWFPSKEALIGGYFRDDAARAAVRHDIRHFIDGIPPRLFATAYRYERS